MNEIPCRHFRVLFGLALIFSALANSDAGAQGKKINVETALLTDKIAIGEPGALIIRTINARPTELPPIIRSPGLSITKTQKENYLQKGTLQETQSEWYFFYQVIGQQEGTFTIPAVTLRIDNQDFTTKPLSITIFARDPSEVTFDTTRPYSCQLKLGASEIYAGQMIPAELKIFVRSIGSINGLDPPELRHDAIVVEGFRQAKQDAMRADGLSFSTATLDGTVFGVTPGRFTFGPAEITVHIIESSMLGIQRRVPRKLLSNPVNLTVKELPETGKPGNFSGAVGSFEVNVTATPTEVNVGDPITLEFEVTGPGNFNTVESPVFSATDPDAWRVYSANKLVDPEQVSDGVKPGRATFTQIIVPRQEHAEIPPFELAFFNPVAGRYDVRSTVPIPIRVEADPERARAAAAGASFTSLAPTALEPDPSFDGIVHIRTTRPDWRPAPTPGAIFQSPSFWLIQAVPSLALFTILGVGLTQVWKKHSETRRRKASEVSFANARRHLSHAGDRGEHFHLLQEALDAWKRECPVKFEALPESARSAYQAIQSRCQWVLYGAPDEDRSTPLDRREVQESEKILDSLAGHLG